MEVVSNDPKTPRQLLKISARVVPLLESWPFSFVSICKPYGETVEKNLRLYSNEHPNFKVIKVDTTVPSLKLKIVGRVYDKDKRAQVALKLTFGPGMKMGPFRGIVRVFTNIKHAPPHLIRIFGDVTGPITVKPGWGLMLSNPRVSDGMAIAGFPIYEKSGNLEIKRVESTLTGMLTQLVTVKKGEKYYLFAIWPGKKVPHNFYKGEIRVYTNSKSHPLITFPISVRNPVDKVPSIKTSALMDGKTY